MALLCDLGSPSWISCLDFSIQDYCIYPYLSSLIEHPSWFKCSKRLPQDLPYVTTMLHASYIIFTILMKRKADKCWHRNRPVSGPFLRCVASSTDLATDIFYKGLKTSYFPHRTSKLIPRQQSEGTYEISKMSCFLKLANCFLLHVEKKCKPSRVV